MSTNKHTPNAKLIAAAPDLLAACQAWIKHFNGEEGDETLATFEHEVSMMNAMHEAVIKATEGNHVPS